MCRSHYKSGNCFVFVCFLFHFVFPSFCVEFPEQCDSRAASSLAKFTQMLIQSHDEFVSTRWCQFECQPLSCVCLFREITAASHLPSPALTCLSLCPTAPQLTHFTQVRENLGFLFSPEAIDVSVQFRSVTQQMEKQSLTATLHSFHLITSRHFC